LRPACDEDEDEASGCLFAPIDSGRPECEGGLCKGAVSGFERGEGAPWTNDNAETDGLAGFRAPTSCSVESPSLLMAAVSWSGDAASEEEEEAAAAMGEEEEEEELGGVLECAPGEEEMGGGGEEEGGGGAVVAGTGRRFWRISAAPTLFQLMPPEADGCFFFLPAIVDIGQRGRRTSRVSLWVRVSCCVAKPK